MPLQQSKKFENYKHKKIKLKFNKKINEKSKIKNTNITSN